MVCVTGPGKRPKLRLEGGLEALYSWLEPSPNLETEALARVLEVHRSLPSTNDRALTLARAGAVHGTCVVALAQTSGRGQRGAVWDSPAGAGLYVSFVLRPQLPALKAPTLPIVVGLALAEAAQSYTQAQVGIKWPNDLLVAQGPLKGKKLGGVLVEASIQSDRIEHAVAGIGLNLRAVPRPPELAAIATSMDATGIAARLEPEAVLMALASRLEMRLSQAESPAGMRQVVQRWREMAFGRGHRVQVQTAQEVVTGILEGVDETGGLVLKTEAGARVLQQGRLQLGTAGDPR